VTLESATTRAEPAIGVLSLIIAPWQRHQVLQRLAGCDVPRNPRCTPRQHRSSGPKRAMEPDSAESLERWLTCVAGLWCCSSWGLRGRYNRKKKAHGVRGPGYNSSRQEAEMQDSGRIVVVSATRTTYLIRNGTGNCVSSLSRTSSWQDTPQRCGKLLSTFRIVRTIQTWDESRYSAM
jgi:hypothetical protein